MYQLKHQDDDDEDVEEDEDDDEFLFIPIMNTPSLTSIEEEAQGFATLSEALLYDLTTYNFDLVGLLQSSSLLRHEEEEEEEPQYFHHASEEAILEYSPEAIIDNDPEGKTHYDRMYRTIQCINFCRHYVKHKKQNENNDPMESKNYLDNAQISEGNKESIRFDYGKRIRDAYVSFWTQQNQSCCNDGETFLFHHPVLENDAYLFHVEDLLNLCSDSLK